MDKLTILFSANQNRRVLHYLYSLSLIININISTIETSLRKRNAQHRIGIDIGISIIWQKCEH